MSQPQLEHGVNMKYLHVTKPDTNERDERASMKDYLQESNERHDNEPSYEQLKQQFERAMNDMDE